MKQNKMTTDYMLGYINKNAEAKEALGKCLMNGKDINESIEKVFRFFCYYALPMGY